MTIRIISTPISENEFVGCAVENVEVEFESPVSGRFAELKDEAGDSTSVGEVVTIINDSEARSTRRTVTEIGTVLDRLLIDELRHRYALYVDTDDLESLMTLWTQDAVFDETSYGSERAEGIDKLREFFVRCLGITRTHVHFITNGITEFDGPDRASGRCNVFWQGEFVDGTVGQAAGYYLNEFEKVEGRWLIKSWTAYPYITPTMRPHDLGRLLKG